MNEKFTPLKIALIYLLAGGLWILFSDLILNVFVKDPQVLTRFLIYEGWVFIIVTALLLYSLVGHYWALLEKSKAVIKESEEEFRSVAETASDGIVTVDSQSKILFANKSTNQIFGYSEDELTGENLTILMPEEMRTAHLNGVKRYLEIGKRRTDWRSREVDGLRKDGSKVPLEISYSEFIRDNEHYFTGFIRDITERKKFQHALIDEKGFFDEVINSLPGIFYIFDAYGNFVRWNKNLENITGYSYEEIATMKPLDFFVKEDRKILAQKIRDVFTKGRAWSEVNLLAKTGEKIPYFFNGIRFIRHERLFLLGEAIDITERKKAEDEVKQKDMEIRQAYVDVFSAVTGGKLIIMTVQEIDSALGRPVTDVIPVPSDKSLANARDALGATLSKDFPGLENADDLIVAVNEGLTNAIKHADGGTLRIYKSDGTAQISITDTGPGIDFSLLPKATLLYGFSTKQTLGIGFSIMLEICDRVLLSTQPGNTTIVLESTPATSKTTEYVMQP